jgi:translation elongation factor EF-Tu-like GTPase
LVMEQELKTLAQGKKSGWDTAKAPLVNKSASRGVSGNKNLSSTKIEHLLEIIDHYKQKLITA